MSATGVATIPAMQQLQEHDHEEDSAMNDMTQSEDIAYDADCSMSEDDK